MAARTLLQQAVPTTFGLKAAGWLVGLVEAGAGSQRSRPRCPRSSEVQRGHLPRSATAGSRCCASTPRSWGCASPPCPGTRTGRRSPSSRAHSPLSAAAAAKIGGDIVLLAQTEVAEVAERESGGSSTMPHKRNPVGAVLAIACARHSRANAGILLESVVQEHERAAGAWHAEWHALTAALAATGGAVAAVRRSLTGLQVDPERMRANIDPVTLAEAGRFGLTVERPEDYLGSAAAFVDRALALHRE